ncbi:MAG: hypothetical protein ABI147_00150 [Acidobacteriaceae bacterium]
MNWRERFQISSAHTQANIVCTALIMIATFAYAVIAGLQLNEMRRTNRNTEAALGNAAKSVQQASEQFQVQLHHFDASLGVTQLQLGKLDASIGQASRLAGATEKANANVLASDRPWIGGMITVSGFTPSSKPSYIFSFPNSGRRPALTERVAVTARSAESVPDFDKDLSENFAQSRAVIVPGGSFTSTRVSNIQVTQDEMNALNNKLFHFYAFGSMTYRDVRTGEIHHTRVCSVYVPLVDAPEGADRWINCPAYNDAD